MSSCPNSDPIFTPAFTRLLGGQTPTPTDLTKLYVICVVVRLALFAGVYVLRTSDVLQAAVGVAGLVTAVRLFPFLQNPGPQWFSKRFQWVVGVALVASSVLVLTRKIPTWTTPAVLFVSLAGGVAQRLVTTFC